MARLIVVLLLLSTTAHAATITGRVVQDGFRVAEYGVFLSGRSDAATLVQDGDGRFVLRDVPPGTRSIVLVGWTFARKTIDVDITPTTREIALGTISVDRGRALAGHVTDVSGAPIAGATVIVYETRPIDLDVTPLELLVEGVQLTTTRYDGTYTVLGLPEDPQGLRALAFGDEMVSSEHLLGARSWTADLNIGRLGTVVGKVTNRRRMTSPIVVATPAGFDGKPTFAGVDPSGSFRLDLPAGVYDVGFPDEIAARLQIFVVGDRTRTVKLTAPTSHVELVVATTSCTIVRLLGARPGSKLPRTEIATEICDDDRVRFSRLPPGPYRVCIDTDEEAECEPLQLRATPARRVVRLRGTREPVKRARDPDWDLE